MKIFRLIDAAKKSNRIVAIEDELGHRSSISSYDVKAGELVQNGKIMSMIDGVHKEFRIKISPCGRWALLYPRYEAGQATIFDLSNGLTPFKQISCGEGHLGFGFEVIPNLYNKLEPELYSVIRSGVVANLTHCKMLNSESCDGGDLYKWKETPDICRYFLWSYNSRFFAYSTDSRYKLYRIDNDSKALDLRQEISFSSGKAICSDFYSICQGDSYFAFSEMTGPIKLYKAIKSGHFRELWAREFTVGHAVEVILSQVDNSLAETDVILTALVYHGNDRGFTVEKYNVSGSVVESLKFPNDGNPCVSMFFNFGKNLWISPSSVLSI